MRKTGVERGNDANGGGHEGRLLLQGGGVWGFGFN